MHSRFEGSRLRARVGFTLIELLTVIAIIGILAAIIIPTVGKVRSTAKKAQCIARLRQWGTVVLNCSNDYKSYIPLFFTWSQGSYDPYITAGKLTPEQERDGTAQVRRPFEAFSTCPTGINGGNVVGNIRQYNFIIPVGLNPVKNDKVFGTYQEQYYYKASDAVAPSQLLLMVEVANYAALKPETLGGIKNVLEAEGSVHKMQKNEGFTRHGGVANALFLDGHVAGLTRSDTDYSQSKEKLDRWFSLK